MADRPNCVSSEMILGVGASSGIARGPAVICHCGEPVSVPRRSVIDAELPSEMARLESAVRAADEQLQRLADEVRQTSGTAEEAIFKAQLQMLHDPLLREDVAARCLRGRINIEAAVSDAADKLVAAFAGLQDPAFRQRAADVRDVANRLLSQLLQQAAPTARDFPSGSIVVAGDLLPSLVASLGQSRIVGIVCERGAATAHAVILARSQGVPVVIHAAGALARIRSGDPLLVDGLSGRVFVRPTQEVQREYERVEADLVASRNELSALIDLPAITQDGVEVRLKASIGKVADARAATAFHADGIGLYRTEFAFTVHEHFPTEEQQLQIYRATAKQIAPREMVLRILDIGSDKLLPYFPLPTEANPSLGRRGTRLMLSHPEILRTQLRAALRLGAEYPVAVLFPMIGGVDEFIAARGAVSDAQAGLPTEFQAARLKPRVGAMIETPAAALMARWIAREADFLSVGTNDLVQYLLTSDRTSSEMAPYYEPLHPAVIQALKLVLDGAAAEGKPVSICGEIAGNPAYTELLLGLGVRVFSVVPREILEIKRIIRSLNAATAAQLAAKALAAGTIAEVQACVTHPRQSDMSLHFSPGERTRVLTTGRKIEYV